MVFLLPFAAWHLYYYLQGHFEEFYFVIYEVTGNYPSSLTFVSSLAYFLSFHLKYLPLTGLFYWGLYANFKYGKNRLWLLAAMWYLLDWLMVILPGKLFDHYYLQLLPVLCLSPLLLASHPLWKRSWWHVNLLRLGSGIFFVLLLITYANQAYFWINEDVNRTIAEELKTDLKEGDIIYTAGKHQVLYYLLDLTPPSRYVHPTLIYHHPEALQLDPYEEMRKVFAKHPKYIIYRDPFPVMQAKPLLLERYALHRDYGKVQVWQILP